MQFVNYYEIELALVVILLIDNHTVVVTCLSLFLCISQSSVIRNPFTKVFLQFSDILRNVNNKTDSRTAVQLLKATD